MDSTNRDKTACMMRVRNEQRWIRRSLEQTFKVARTVVVFDDGSTDGTLGECIGSMGLSACPTSPIGGILVVEHEDKELHYISSPFRNRVVREKESVNEVRDKNLLWYYVKSSIECQYVLCLDGDEVLSNRSVREFDKAWNALRTQERISLPFVFLWGSEDSMRVDGVYASIWHARMFALAGTSPDELYGSHFDTGISGGFHCGSIPGGLRDPAATFCVAVDLPIVHYGYIDDSIRKRKFEFYNKIDPNNMGEGGYRHIIGESNHRAPGPVRLEPYIND